MPGNAAGALKTAARRVGCAVDEYERRVLTEKWCTACRTWHPRSEFVRDRSRGDGLKSKCRAAERGRQRGWRDPLKEKARHAVNAAVRYERLPAARTIACTDCGHVGDDRRHEYDHYRGYEREHRLDVECVCTLCHADREKRRRDG